MHSVFERSIFPFCERFCEECKSNANIVSNVYLSQYWKIYYWHAEASEPGHLKRCFDLPTGTQVQVFRSLKLWTRSCSNFKIFSHCSARRCSLLQTIYRFANWRLQSSNTSTCHLVGTIWYAIRTSWPRACLPLPECPVERFSPYLKIIENP